MITETRKAIIELIEPYMDKTLSEGCLFYKDEDEHEDRIYYKIITLKDSEKWVTYMIYNGHTRQINQMSSGGSWIETNDVIVDDIYSVYYYKELDEKGEIKILGNYDTTALLKYIDETGFGHIFTQKEIFTDEIRVFTEDQYEGGKVTEFGDNLGWLPCKPLHLYTPQEDKDLLTLLQKIGN